MFEKIFLLHIVQMHHPQQDCLLFHEFSHKMESVKNKPNIIYSVNKYKKIEMNHPVNSL